MKRWKGKKYFRSLRFRILIILIILGSVPGIVISWAVVSGCESRAVANRTVNVRRQCEILCSLLIRENYINDSSSQVVNSKLELFSNIYNGRIVLVNRDFRIVKDTFGTDEGRLLLSPLVLQCVQGGEPDSYDQQGAMLELTVPVKSPEVKQLQGVMLVYVSTAEIRATIGEMRTRASLIVGLVVVLTVGLGSFFSRMLVKPFGKVTRAIEDLTDGFQDEAITVGDYTETILITEAFNKMLVRMKTLDESRQEFVANVSHELKTPMTSIKVLADSLAGQTDVPVELYREFMEDITREIDRENQIITDLLSMVKLDKRSSDIHIAQMNINQLLEEIMKRLRPIAGEHKIDLILDCKRPVTADVDEVKFSLALTNLVENGIKYNVEEGWVRVTLDADHKEFTVTVEDSGMGIPEESLGRIFERFYRVDKSHSREIGGTGLGLAITKSIIVMHRGSIRVTSKEGEGTSFKVRVPLLYSAAPEEG